jgi:adenylate cyclase
VIVDVDERSLSTIGQWPWRRDVMGSLIARLREMGAATIALDIVFAEPDRVGDSGGSDRRPTARPRATSDEALAATLRDGRVVLGYAMRFDNVPAEGNACVLHPVGPRSFMWEMKRAMRLTFRQVAPCAILRCWRRRQALRVS